MKLGGKGRDVESFVDQLKSEGENVITPKNNINQIKTPAIKSDIDECVLIIFLFICKICLT